MSYEEAAEVCNVAVGTVKSRVNRARSKLAFRLDLTSEAELGPDNVTKAALAAEETCGLQRQSWSSLRVQVRLLGLLRLRDSFRLSPTLIDAASTALEGNNSPLTVLQG